jgi:hypothetical protein
MIVDATRIAQQGTVDIKEVGVVLVPAGARSPGDAALGSDAPSVSL